METRKATIKREASNTYLVLEVKKSTLEIVLTDDNPNSIKSGFNILLKELKNGLFQYKLEDGTEDLFKNICSEYIKQLNAELKSVFEDLKEYELLEG